MADENQNAEMEDILSSIKNILEEDSNSQPVADVLPAETDVVDDLLNTTAEVDDILELSPDMRIEQTAVQPVVEEAESVDISLPEIEDDIADSLNIGIEDETSDSVFDEALDNSAEIEQPLNTDFEQISEPESAVSISEAYTEDDGVSADTSETAEPLEIPAQKNSGIAESDNIFSPEVFDDAEIQPAEQAETAPVIETELAPVSAVLPEEEPVAEAVSEEVVEESPVENAAEEIVEESPVFEEPVAEVVADTPKADTADVSAGIISNFAKMFAREEPVETAPAADETPNITTVGNTGKTLEEFVLESISKVIGQEISRQWNDGADFRALAEAEINRQTKEWINDNLPALVEKVVKQEIERVIAKVGS